MSNRLASEHGMRLSSDRGWVYNDEAAQQRSNNGRVDTLTRMDTVRRPVRPRQMNSYNNSNWNSTDGGGTVGPMYFDPNLQKWRSHRESDEELLDLPSDNASQSTINQSFDGEQHLARDTGYRSRPLLQDGAGSYGRRYGSPQSSQASGLSPSNSQLYHELNQVMSPGSDSAGNNGSPQRYYAENSDGVGIYDDDGTDIDADHESYRYNPRHAKDYPPSYSTYASDQRHHTHAHVHAEARAAEEDEAHARRYDQSQAQVDEQVQARMRRSARTKARESTFELGDTTHNNTQHTEVYHNHNSNGSGSGSDRSFASVQSQSGQLTRKAVGYGHAYRGAQARGPVAPTHPQIAAPRSRTYNPRNTYLMDNRRREGGEADYANTIENGVQGYYGDINNATEVERVGGDMGYQSWPAHNYTQAERYRSEGNHHSHRRGSGREDSGDSLDLARGTNHLVDYRNPKHPKVQGMPLQTRGKAVLNAIGIVLRVCVCISLTTSRRYVASNTQKDGIECDVGSGVVQILPRASVHSRCHQ
ncbi:hypothetical protein SARC_10578 [Sphaeroforma arctica JP610]|uniref:Uncharacterized protein n=1 Tax=Sphaeroforma arctica JP610 TaxID=667725 RepID=A0A0L0FJI6_9EUKA|nr:hypothetical protein SARC_10578 [Sphaeroforma arctica JP610]KNC76947.1 hypothetical protein SARC_10578 [Sphaeroforma arctica JP610]|eukprot:XP_014150849.1 hypothetical protein SARC_10578 [Sphaeroforma arctica JP610]